ncbi:Crp/Fnr family transcriptional regulator [Roseivirga misakiensis]|uniref:Crp/Fnr family transcriptional regulator n=1 Tax=Roseivirga misakiensis TaxID=1563681 RepID=A0A1E5SY45_9BACT|nr:Crp/Fnr family transcriptional regulator [Roseivirga misakiensis]OEK04035.1 hypothetical protein BFP71_11095 [Roseivirga misakiensis]
MSLSATIDFQPQVFHSGHLSLLAELNDSELDTLSSHKSKITYNKGQVLFYQGTRPMGLFCIHSGKVKVSQNSSKGGEQILYISKQDDFLGYRALLSEEYYAATATVTEEACISFIPKEDFLSAICSNPGFLQKLLNEVCKHLGQMEKKVTQFSAYSVRERLAGTLLTLKQTYGVEGTKCTIIDLSLTRQELANLIGTATETLIRLLSEFRTEGLIRLEGKRIGILDEKKLAKEADFFREISF